ncbi:MAG: hypothetical protein V7K64_22990 [Nostoc sp.]|uniref:hypothetical protein n=1 Tax=unclassified Nostoc TaxID=2593658 RepID=UPI001D9BD48B|nr:hypothetical protein [Nostoc sp. JL34]MBN3885866.1 hypothetical protein [Nostoc sp. JL34]
MNANEYQNLYCQIEEIINYYKLGWIIEQVNNSIHEGKIVSIEDKLAKKNREKTPRIKREDYTAKEKVLLLLNAFETAVINTIELEKEVGEFLTEEISDPQLEPKIKFYSEEEENSHQFIFSSDTINLRQQEAREIQNLLNQLHQELEK